MMGALRTAAGALLLAALAACLPPRFVPPEPQQVSTPDPAEVAYALFLVGDPGASVLEKSPVLARLQADVEWWAGRLGRDSAVSMLVLGDVVYPLGLHPPGHDAWPQDSAIVASQVRVLAGPQARRHATRGYFMAGNHDWGLEDEWEGYVRLNRLDEFLEAQRALTGVPVELVPEAGQGGPVVVDVGDHLRLLMLDTSWWLLDGGRAFQTHGDVLAAVEAAIGEAGDREVLIAAHHPFRSGGEHGGEFSFWETFGVRYLLARSGAILQDLTSLPYRELEGGLREVFRRTRPPLIFAGGHEHNLQVIRGTEPTDPVWNLVSGSVSKLSNIGPEEGLQYAAQLPGYIRLLVERDGGMTIQVEGTPPRYQKCAGSAEEVQRCMQEGIAAFSTLHSQRLR